MIIRQHAYVSTFRVYVCTIGITTSSVRSLNSSSFFVVSCKNPAVDKEARWLIDSPTYLSQYTPPVLSICQFYFKHINILAPTQSANNLFHLVTVFLGVKMKMF